MRLKDVTGCVVLASCRSDEASYEWDQRGNGVFTYWLSRALEGGADRDGDRKVTFGEVYKYTHERVQTTVEQVFNEEQTPARIVGEDVDGDPVLLELQPEPTESVCRRLAEHLDLDIRYHGLESVAVLEFGMPLGNVQGALSHAILPGYCAREVRIGLTQLAGDDYRVLNDQQTAGICKGVRVEDIGTPEALERVSASTARPPASVVTGTLNRGGRVLHVACRLNAFNSGEQLAVQNGAMPLSVDLLADLGESFTAIDGRRPPGSSYDQQVVDWAIDAAEQGHPALLGPDSRRFPFTVELWSYGVSSSGSVPPGTRPRKMTFESRVSSDGSELIVPARENEVFEIRVRSDYRDPVTVAIAVDGLNVLGKRRERLGKARRWHQEPGDTVSYEGWYLPNDKANGRDTESFERRRFVFRSVPDSQAGRQTYGDSPGVITVAFFDAAGRSPVVGSTFRVDEGESEDQDLNSVPFRDGKLLGVTQIRYVKR